MQICIPTVFPAPLITSITPTSGTKNSTVNFTIVGTSFELEGKTSVRIEEDVADTILDTTIISITPTTIKGIINITNDAMAGSYALNVTTVDGGFVRKINAFAVSYLAIPTILYITPVSGYRNSTVGFSVIGTNFQPGNTVVAFRNQTTGSILNSAELNSVTSTKIIGNITIPYNTPTGLYRLDVMTTDGGVTNKVNTFTVLAVPAPTITTITPVSGTKNSVAAFTLAGTNFQTDGRTSVRIVDDTSGTELATTLLSVTSTKIIGSVIIPLTVPAGKYRLEVTTLDGGKVNKYEAFTVNYLPIPVITTMTPASGYKNSTVPFTLVGNNFLDGGTVVRLRIVGGTLNATLTSVNTTTVKGNFTIPYDAVSGAYRLDVITNGGGFNSRLNAFAVSRTPAPTITSISPGSGIKNNTVAFTVSGTNFQPGQKTLLRIYEDVADTELAVTTLSVTPTQIIGSVNITNDALAGTYNVEVNTVDGGMAIKTGAFSVSFLPIPIMTSITPVSGLRGRTVGFSVIGANFQMNNNTVVAFRNQTTGANLNTTELLSVTSTRIIGNITIPSPAPPGFYRIDIMTTDGGVTLNPNAFRVL